MNESAAYQPSYGFVTQKMNDFTSNQIYGPKVVPNKYKQHCCRKSSTPSSCSSGSGKSFSYEAFLEE